MTINMQLELFLEEIKTIKTDNYKEKIAEKMFTILNNTPNKSLNNHVKKIFEGIDILINYYENNNNFDCLDSKEKMVCIFNEINETSSFYSALSLYIIFCTIILILIAKNIMSNFLGFIIFGVYLACNIMMFPLKKKVQKRKFKYTWDKNILFDYYLNPKNKVEAANGYTIINNKNFFIHNTNIREFIDKLPYFEKRNIELEYFSYEKNTINLKINKIEYNILLPKEFSEYKQIKLFDSKKQPQQNVLYVSINNTPYSNIVNFYYYMPGINKYFKTHKNLFLDMPIIYYNIFSEQKINKESITNFVPIVSIIILILKYFLLDKDNVHLKYNS